jgi:hypothetical protein
LIVSITVIAALFEVDGMRTNRSRPIAGMVMGVSPACECQKEKVTIFLLIFFTILQLMGAKKPQYSESSLKPRPLWTTAFSKIGRHYSRLLASPIKLLRH